MRDKLDPNLLSLLKTILPNIEGRDSMSMLLCLVYFFGKMHDASLLTQYEFHDRADLMRSNLSSISLHELAFYQSPMLAQQIREFLALVEKEAPDGKTPVAD